ncbi:MAG: tRNA 2-thiouridine(34) synthase MnmA, partial [Planctomycetota bacterium]|nr:tRNA 2-thiouridine(34) synthase MnmA [Planctomycetota bacterium]
GACPAPAAATHRPLKIGHQGCCSVSDAADARLVAAHLGIPLYICNFKKDFARVIDYFVDEYARGRTPNPCVRCNDWLKFGKLHDYARSIDADFVASGHYARIENGRLLRAVDHAKDQSYVLFGIPRAQLARTLLPIGALRKPDVRALAAELGLPVAEKPDSQEICFVPDNDYAALVEHRAPHLARSGPILDQQGAVVGHHTGHHRFTMGQRRGLSVALGYPIYVTGKDPDSNTVRVGPRQDLLASGCDVAEANWLTGEPAPGESRPVLARYRSTGPLVPATMRTLEPAPAPAPGGAPAPSGRAARFSVDFDQPQEAVTPGQALVLYGAHEPDHVLAGGWIEHTRRP